MTINSDLTRLEEFKWEGLSQKITFVTTFDVTDGVKCHVYSFDDDQTKDLGIINIEPGQSTPLQKVLGGKRTVEGYVSGKGKLIITRVNGRSKIYDVDNEQNNYLNVDVGIGDLMQWHASPDSTLTVYEVCYPPYEDGRYENIK